MGVDGGFVISLLARKRRSLFAVLNLHDWLTGPVVQYTAVVLTVPSHGQMVNQSGSDRQNLTKNS